MEWSRYQILEKPAECADKEIIDFYRCALYIENFLAKNVNVIADTE